MRRFKQSMIAALAVLGLVIAVASVARAQRANFTVVATEKPSAARATSTSPVGRTHAGAHLDSVLTDPRAAVMGPQQGTGWLLHYGTEHDACARIDATIATMRAVCVSR